MRSGTATRHPVSGSLPPLMVSAVGARAALDLESATAPRLCPSTSWRRGQLRTGRADGNAIQPLVAVKQDTYFDRRAPVVWMGMLDADVEKRMGHAVWQHAKAARPLARVQPNGHAGPPEPYGFLLDLLDLSLLASSPRARLLSAGTGIAVAVHDSPLTGKSSSVKPKAGQKPLSKGLSSLSTASRRQDWRDYDFRGVVVGQTSRSEAPPRSMPPPSRDKITVGSRVTIAQDADLRGEISIGTGTVIHPRAVVFAQHGPIIIGSNCIIEELVFIVNKRTEPMHIGDDNLFEVGSRIEAAGIGSSNVFGVKSKVASTIQIGSQSNIGAGCTVLPSPLWPRSIDELFSDDEVDTPAESEGSTDAETGAAGGVAAAAAPREPADDSGEMFEALPDRTIVYGTGAIRRFWSGEGSKQQAALHAKHLEYLKDMIPKGHKLKIIQAVRAPDPPSKPSA